MWGLSEGALQHREDGVARQCHSLCVDLEREKYFREQQTMNLRCSHAVLPENICTNKFCVGDILTAGALLLVWTYFL